MFTLTGSELTVLSPESMGDVHSARGVLLARVRYRPEPGGRARRFAETVVIPAAIAEFVWVPET